MTSLPSRFQNWRWRVRAGAALLAAATGCSAKDDALPDGPPADALEEGWELIRVANFEDAERYLRRALEAEEPETLAEACYAMGHLWQYRIMDEDLAQARQYYQRVVDEFPTSRTAAWAMLALARMESLPKTEKDQDIDQARQMYQQIIEDYPGQIPAHEAAYRYAHTFLEQAQDLEAQQEGIDYLLDYIQKYPETYLAAVMFYDIAGVYTFQKQWTKAVDFYIRADEKDQQFEQRFGDRTLSFNRRSVMYFQIAQIAEHELKNYDLAIKWYRRIVNDLDRDNRQYWARKSIERLTGAQQEPSDADDGSRS